MLISRSPVDLRHRETYVRYIAQLDETVPKEDFIVELARGRSVLDLGCIDHSADTATALGDRWLHARLGGVAERLVGVDMLEADAEALNSRGYDIHTAWIDPRVLHELVSRSPLEIVDFAWTETRFRVPLTRGRVLPLIVNPLMDVVMRRRPVLRADFAVVLMLRASA